MNFEFDREGFESRAQQAALPGKEVVPTDARLFHEMKGSVVPAYFWKDENDFVANGAGFSVLYNGQLASTAYLAFILGNQLEIGIETVEAFRRKGLAWQSCVALINYCLANNFEPVWACRMEKTGSYKLAQKLGFVPSRYIPYYRLSK